MGSSIITAPGPQLSQAAIERIAGERFRPKVQDDDANGALLASISRSALEVLIHVDTLDVPEGLTPPRGDEPCPADFVRDRYELGALTPPPPPGPDFEALIGDRYEVDMWPKFVMDEEDLGVGLPKGVPADVVARQRENAQKQYEAAREAQKKAQEDAQKAAEEAKKAQENDSGPTDDPDMPNPDSGDPGGPRSFDPHFYLAQENWIKAISQIATR